MRVILNSVYQSTIDPGNVHITRSMSDPVPTCSVDIKDNNSSLQVSAMQELLIIDDQVIPNPTVNLFIDPSILGYNTNWNTNTSGSVAPSQIGGGGLQIAFTSASSGSYGGISSRSVPSVVAGQSYVLSFYLQGAAAYANIKASIQLAWIDAAGAATGPAMQINVPTIPGSLTRYSATGIAPANTAYAAASFTVQTTANGVTGTVDLFQVQLEPLWFPTLSYPLPFCGPSQTNCVQLPLGQWIRQYRKFAGFVNHSTTGNYVGNVRTITVDAVGYAWLASLILCNNGYTNQYDSAILINLLNTYLPGLVNTANIIQGVQLSNTQSNWDDLRTLSDNLASQSTYYWTIDYYWNAVYVPPGYITMPISLICDNSGTPDMVTTFPAYNFSAEMDFTQPGSVILVIGSGSNVAEVIDPAQSALYSTISGYAFKAGSTFMRKVNESSLQSVTDCTNRGMAELIQYDYPRNIYHLSTNVELIPGEAIPVTSNTDGLNATTLLIQQVQATWMGTDETLKDVWEYQADLGAINRAATNILSRIFRATNSNSSAPAISATTLAVFEKLGIVDTAGQGTTSTTYAATILGDGPIAYYRLGELSGTTADDFSGHGYQGTLHGGVTLNQSPLLSNGDTDRSMSFNGSTGYISLPTALIPTGSGHAWSLECWCRVTSLPSNTWNSMVNMGAVSNGTLAGIYINNTSGTVKFAIGVGGTNSFSSGTVATNTTYHVVGTYDGTSIRLYVNGSLVGGPLAATVNLGTTYASIGADGSPAQEFFPGTIDEAAYYNYALSSTQITNHYNTGI